MGTVGLNKTKINRIFEILIAAAFVAVFLYVLSVAIKVTTGVSRTIDPPNHRIRLQVLNGCGEPGLAARVSDQLAGYTDPELEIKIVDTDDFDIAEVPKSFLISRDEDTDAARKLAKELGLDPSDIIVKPLENNYRHISVTLVLGLDHENIRLERDTKEN
jgi:hypothetical protein